jgi:ankyrin repeat protein
MADRPDLSSPQAGARGMDELQYAAYCGDDEAVRYWLASGADPRAVDDFGCTALHWNVRMACAGGGDRVAIIRALIEAGADPNHRDNEGNTVLASAIEATASGRILEALRSYGAQ